MLSPVIILAALLLTGCAQTVMTLKPVSAKGSYKMDAELPPIKARNAALDNAKLKALWKIIGTLESQGKFKGASEAAVKHCMEAWLKTQKLTPKFGADGTVEVEVIFNDAALKEVQSCIRIN